MLTFEPFRIWFIKHHPTQSKEDFRRETGFAPTTASKVWRDRLPVSTDTIERLCKTYNLRVDQVIEYRPDLAPKT